MKHIVWIQSNNLGGSDNYFIEGEKISESDSKILSQAVKNIIEIQGLRECSSKRNASLRVQTGYPNFTLAFCRFKGLLFKSLFNEIADDGRPRGFVCYAKSINTDFVWNYLKSCSSSLGYTLRDSDYLILDKYISIVKKRCLFQNIMAIVLFSIIVILLITVLL